LPEPGAAQEAKQSLELLNEMYTKIRGSITYQAREREQQKKEPSAPEKRPVHRAVMEQKLMTLCPRCNGSIAKGAKTCPICKTTFRSPLEKLFSRRALIGYCLVLLLGMAAFFAYQQVGKAKDSVEFESLEKIAK